MSFLDAKAHLVQCNKCGTERQSYNDPRTSTSVIECKKCFESHRLWTHVRCVEDEDPKGDRPVKAPRPSSSLSTSTSSESPAVAVNNDQPSAGQAKDENKDKPSASGEVREDQQHPPFSNPLAPPKPRASVEQQVPKQSDNKNGGGSPSNVKENGCGCVLQ